MEFTRRDLEKRFKNYNDLTTVKHAQEMINMSESPIFEMLNQILFITLNIINSITLLKRLLLII